MTAIAVTGGSGKAGRAVVSDLADHGHAVTNIDVAASRHPDEPTVVADLTDFGQALEARFSPEVSFLLERGLCSLDEDALRMTAAGARAFNGVLALFYSAPVQRHLEGLS